MLANTGIVCIVIALTIQPHIIFSALLQNFRKFLHPLKCKIICRIECGIVDNTVFWGPRVCIMLILFPFHSSFALHFACLLSQIFWSKRVRGNVSYLNYPSLTVRDDFYDLNSHKVALWKGAAILCLGGWQDRTMAIMWPQYNPYYDALLSYTLCLHCIQHHSSSMPTLSITKATIFFL